MTDLDVNNIEGLVRAISDPNVVDILLRDIQTNTQVTLPSVKRARLHKTKTKTSSSDVSSIDRLAQAGPQVRLSEIPVDENEPKQIPVLKNPSKINNVGNSTKHNNSQARNSIRNASNSISKTTNSICNQIPPKSNSKTPIEVACPKRYLTESPFKKLGRSTILYGEEAGHGGMGSVKVTAIKVNAAKGTFHGLFAVKVALKATDTAHLVNEINVYSSDGVLVTQSYVSVSKLCYLCYAFSNFKILTQHELNSVHFRAKSVFGDFKI